MEKKNILHNAAWIIGCRIIQAVLGFVVTAISARYLGPSGYGIINYAASIVAFCVPVMQLGLNATLVYEIVQESQAEGKVLGTAIGMSVVSGFVCILGIGAFVSMAEAGEPITIIVCVLYSLQLVFQSLDLIQYWFQAKLLSKYASVATLIAYLVMSGYKILLLVLQKDVYWFALAQALDFCVIAIILLVIYHWIGGSRLEFSVSLIKRLFSRSKHYILSGLMMTVFAQTDRIMLKMMVDETAVGYYSAAVTCAGITQFIFAAIIDSARPALLEKAQTGKAAFEKGISSVYSVVIYLALAQSAAMTLLADVIVKIIYGTQYGPSVSALRIVVWYTTFSYMGAVRNIWILAEGKEKYLWIINTAGAAANVVLNGILIPRMGVNGAALASLITQLLTNFVIGFIIKPIRPNNRLVLHGLDPRFLAQMLRKVWEH